MGSKDKRRFVARKTSFESLESRQMFSAEPVSGALGDLAQNQTSHERMPAVQAASVAGQHTVDGLIDLPMPVQHLEQPADFWLGASDERDLGQLVDNIEQQLASADNLTGLTQVRQDYGFTGAGQTVAIVDSGIAYDHFALGGGLGANYRVVGGWDFTEENDANPYDDGPLGGHGSHVAGIVGADRLGPADDGVASGVDLVGLRVFNDAGNSYFTWVESALKWVHNNRNSFQNPITAINLSLGAAWNATSIPSWATLEDEFAQLAADGIFISVSAGNSFATYKAAGLSYPAASPNVVPVMSVDGNGSLSSFSQRQSRAIAAPGQYIVSTVPDYVGNHNGVTDDFASYSGTSMAAPYVAGASVLVREAMQFVGYTNITQWTIYNHMMSTADTIFDAATNQSYKRLNLEKAIDALMPADDYGSSVVEACNLGTLSGNKQVSGVIGKLDDADYFKFTAGASGTVTFTATTADEMKAAWTGSGAVSGTDGGTYTMNVVAGQTYTIGLATGGVLGHYTLSADMHSSFSFTDLGTVAQSQLTDASFVGAKWYKVKASQGGWITAVAAYDAAGGSVHVAWFDTNMQRMAEGADVTGASRADRCVKQGDELYLCVEGNNARLSLQLTNLVSVDGSNVMVTGTSGDDTFAFVAGDSQHAVTVNGATYQFDAKAVSSISFAGGVGYDTMTMWGSAGADTATVRVGNAKLAGSGYTAVETGVENVLLGGGSNDQALFYDTAGNDAFGAWVDHAVLVGTNYHHEAWGFGKTTAYASSGTDSATLYDSADNDTYTAWSNRATMSGGSRYFNEVRGFDSTLAIATTGTDRAIFYDSSGDDTFTAWSEHALMTGAGYANTARGFRNQIAYASMGFDRSTFNDTAGNDRFSAWSNRATMLSGSSYFNEVRGFDATLAIASTGSDAASFFDTVGDDRYDAWSDHASMTGSGYYNEARGFDNTTAYATAGTDTATFYDSAGDDKFFAWSDRAYMLSGSRYYNEARGFDGTKAYATTGNDQATLYESASDDQLRVAAWGAYLESTTFCNEASGFDKISATLAVNGNDAQVVEPTDYVFELLGGTK